MPSLGQITREMAKLKQAVDAMRCLCHSGGPVVVELVSERGEPIGDSPTVEKCPVPSHKRDVVVVQINPVVRHMTPTSSQEIINRINEITFNSSLLSEYRAINFVTRLIDQGRLPRGTGPGEYRRINVHRIALEDAFRKLSAASKLSSDYEFFVMLRNGGRRAARNFLDAHFDDIGRRSTIDLTAQAHAEQA